MARATGLSVVGLPIGFTLLQGVSRSFLNKTNLAVST
jgi:hypothetical protein